MFCPTIPQRRLSGWCLFGVISCCQLGFAQQPGSLDSNIAPYSRPPQQAAPERPVAGQLVPPSPAGTLQPQKPEEIDPALMRILQTWEAKSAAVKKMNGTFARHKYESTFGVVEVAKGEYWYEAPDKGRMDFLPDDRVPETQPPATTQRNGKTYSLHRAGSERWICNGQEILNVDDDDKQYNRIVIPEQYRGVRISEGPLPFLFGMKADKLIERYRLQLGEMHDPQKILHIVAIPLLPSEQREFRRAEILLNPQTYMPTYLKLDHTSDGNLSIYSFQKHEPVTFWLTGAPWNISLRGYELLYDSERPPRSAEQDQGIIIK